MVFCVTAPATVASPRGQIPNINDKIVIKIGLKRETAALIAASLILWPFSRNSLANSMIKMAFFEDMASREKRACASLGWA